MGAQGVVGRHLDGDLPGEPDLHPPCDVDLGQLFQLMLGLGLEFGLFLGEVGALGVGLGADRDIFPGRHRHGPGDQGRDAGHEDRPPALRGGGDPDDQAGGGDDAVIGPQHGGAQPADAVDAVGLSVKAGHGGFRVWFDPSDHAG